ncbi:MAG TPA: hypothetical protein VGQ51_05355 [Puia sp.]|jgi:hypothetical protein|nr:hypothetical protein [Puia sp.]
MNTRVQYDYNTLCILDYSDKELEESENPFAWVVLTAKKALLRGKNLDKQLLKGKLWVFRKLMENGLFADAKLLAILKFLDKYIVFEETETNLIFNNRVDKISGKKNTMDILSEIVAEPLVRKKVRATVREIVRNLLTETSLSVEEIARSTNQTVSFVKSIKNRLRKNIK